MNTSVEKTEAAVLGIAAAQASPSSTRAWRTQSRGAQPVTEFIGVLVVCGVRLYREGLSATLAQHAGPRIRVVGAAATAAEALRLVAAHRPQLALLDSALPESVSVARDIVREMPDTRVLVLAMNESDDDVIAIAEAGVSGYLPRDGSHEDLIAAIERAARGEVLCPPNIVASLFRRMAAMAGERSAGAVLPGLTVREQEIVLLLGEGISNKEIARRLSIRVATVKNHVHNILQKLGVTRRFAVAALLMRQREHG